MSLIDPCPKGHTDRDASWWEYDGQGIPLCRVCEKCCKAKLSRYRPEILWPYGQKDVDEPIEPDYWAGRRSLLP